MTTTNSPKNAFTLIELLVVVSIIALLVSILLPALGRAREQARAVVCSTRLKTLSLANEMYSNENRDFYVPAIDETMVADAAFSWNSNMVFRELIGTSNSEEGADRFVMTEDYWCPSDKKVRDDSYWAQPGISYINRVSYGYNMTDWSLASNQQYNWSPGDMVDRGISLAVKSNRIERPLEKLMFIDAGDFWVDRDSASYRDYWDQWGEDIQTYRNYGIWGPTFYRHSEGVNLAFFDGRVERMAKQDVYIYLDNQPYGDSNANNRLWFLHSDNIR